MDFITGLSRSKQGYNAIFTVVDALSKMAHFIPTVSTLTAEEFLYFLEIGLRAIMGYLL